MSSLPKGWITTEIGEIAQIETGNTPSKKRADFFDGDYPFFKPGDLDAGRHLVSASETLSDQGYAVARQIPKGSVLVTCIGNLGKSGVTSSASSCNQQINAILPTPAASPEFLNFWVKSVRDWMEEHASATTVTILNKGRFSTAPLQLPPLPEQRRIVAKLNRLSERSSAARTHLTHVTALANRAKQAVLAEAYQGRLTAGWRGQNSTHSAEKEVEEAEDRKTGKLKVRGARATLEKLQLGKLPENWAWIQNYRLAQDASNAICAGPFGTIFKAKDFRDKGVPIIFLRHVGPGEYKTNKPGFMDPDVWAEFHQPYSVYGGELLVTKLGDPPGTACIYPDGIGTAMVTPDVMKMNVDEEVADSRYLMHFFNSPIALNIVTGLAFGATRLRIDLTLFKAFPIPLAPRNEQREIVRRIEAAFARIDRLTAEASRASHLLDRLDECLLAKAFRGELVPQDPNDEPAEALLVRIREARAATPKPKRAQRKINA